MKRIAKVSVVLPVRDAQTRIVGEVERLLEGLADLSAAAIELVLVDDGSRDATPELLDELRGRFPQVRVARHRAPRGMEAAGQTGLERASGELVFIQESDAPVRMEDLRRLYRMAADPNVVAARAQSTPRPLSGPLLRRLRAWGTRAQEAAEATTEAAPRVQGLQMVRRPHLQMLASPAGAAMELEAERTTSTTMVSG